MLCRLGLSKSPEGFFLTHTWMIPLHSGYHPYKLVLAIGAVIVSAPLLVHVVVVMMSSAVEVERTPRERLALPGLPLNPIPELLGTVHRITLSSGMGL